VAALICWTTAVDVPVGAKCAKKDATSNPGSAASAIVGSSARHEAQLAPVTASALASPLRINGVAEGRLSKIIVAMAAIETNQSRRTALIEYVQNIRGTRLLK
jgi:hypothetical protein